ncbi:hypothetical protein N7466_008783 [Penicillium verhagenii]|uniref:uncharacterized protein n=1 Tax=Penicillium verhagenii TaxID=1562060 RepID=UPI0025451502|nr:uncharacterized protein N7466_008783 [Penicillium verhagenii]KAJ5924596.1 hypothetical protein N7466_008783 [Penicillium verhagenii]
MPRVTRSSCLPQSQPAIQIFTKATKAGVTPQLPGKKLASLPVSPSKKRKLQEIENIDRPGPQSVEEQPDTPSKTLKLSQLSVSSPRSGHYATPKRTPSRKTRISTIAESPSTPDTPSKQRTINFAKVVPAPKEPVLAPRVACVTDFMNMHSAFIKAISLHAAHNGPCTAADLREFLPSVTSIWKKRKVHVKDLQRLLWVWDHSLKGKDISYRLANYGLGKVCLERDVFINEQGSALQDAFEQAFDLLWEQTEESLKEVEEADRPAVFIETLGLAIIHESLTPFTAFQKGQQRLQDLRGGVIRMKTELFRSEANMTSSKPTAPTGNRRQGLLERLKNKELRQSKLPPPPTKKELLRRSAVEHAEEVAGILALLRPAGHLGTGIKAMFANQRKPYKLETIVEHVRDSIRTPIPSEEVQICLEILADARVAGNWVTLVTVNGMQSVVLKSCKDVAPKDLGAKIALVQADWEKTSSCSPLSVLKI